MAFCEQCGAQILSKTVPRHATAEQQEGSCYIVNPLCPVSAGINRAFTASVAKKQDICYNTFNKQKDGERIV